MENSIIISPKNVQDCLGKSRNPIKLTYYQYICDLFTNKFTNENSNDEIVTFIQATNIKHIFILALFNKVLLNKLEKYNLYYISHDPHNMMNYRLSYYKKIFTLGDNIFFKNIYPSVYLKSHVFKWYVDDNSYNINHNQNVFSFGTANDLYPIRTTIINNQKLIHESFTYPGWSDKVTGNRLYEMINNHRITIVSGAEYPYNYMNYKYLEVFMCKSLCFCTYVPGLDDYGYIPYKHYIPIDNTYYNILKKQRTIFDLKKLNNLVNYYLHSDNTELVDNIINNAYNHTFNIFNKNKVFHECKEHIIQTISES